MQLELSQLVKSNLSDLTKDILGRPTHARDNLSFLKKKLFSCTFTSALLLAMIRWRMTTNPKTLPPIMSQLGSPRP